MNSTKCGRDFTLNVRDLKHLFDGTPIAIAPVRVGLEPDAQRLRVAVKLGGNDIAVLTWARQSSPWATKPVRRLFTLIGTPSRRCTRQIFASCPTLVTPCLPLLKS